MKQHSVHQSLIVRLLRSFPPVVFMLLALMIICSIWIPGYFALKNIMNILVQSVPLMILAFGQTLIVLTQGTDLSLGAQVSFATVIWVFMASKGIPLPIGAVITIILTTFIGIINGNLVARGKIQPFIATLGMQNVLNSISLLITSGSSIYFASELFQVVMETKIAGFALPIYIAALVFIAVYIILKYTRFGTNVKALGGNQEALVMAGVNTIREHIRTYAVVGAIAGICGLVTTCRVESGQPMVGIGWEFDAVAATLLGGTSLRGGKGGVGGTVFGVLLIKILQNGLNMAGIKSLYHNFLIGGIVLIAIVFDAVIRFSRANVKEAVK